MDNITRDRLLAMQRPWSEVEARVQRDRAERYRATGPEGRAQALWATECELRRSPGYARARELDLQHHLAWRHLLEQLARGSAR